MCVSASNCCLILLPMLLQLTEYFFSLADGGVCGMDRSKRWTSLLLQPATGNTNLSRLEQTSKRASAECLMALSMPSRMRTSPQ